MSSFYFFPVVVPSSFHHHSRLTRPRGPRRRSLPSAYRRRWNAGRAVVWVVWCGSLRRRASRAPTSPARARHEPLQPLLVRPSGGPRRGAPGRGEQPYVRLLCFLFPRASACSPGRSANNGAPIPPSPDLLVPDFAWITPLRWSKMEKAVPYAASRCRRSTAWSSLWSLATRISRRAGEERGCR